MIEQPRYADAQKGADEWFARGLALKRQGKAEASLECFKRVIQADHDNVQALLHQAEIQLELGACEDALDSLELALAFDAQFVPAWLMLAQLARRQHDFGKAVEHIERATKIAPHDAQLHFELALSHNACGNTEQAIASYKQTLELEPRHAGACVNLGLIYLTQRSDARLAQELFQRAAALQPELVAAQANLGLALQEQGEIEAALAHYETLIRAYPEIVEYRWNRGIALLSIGDFQHGWEDYELRNSRHANGNARRFPFAPWNGLSLADHTLLVYAEQGIGDEIMFASCLADVVSGARGVVVECDVRLQNLFARSFPAVRVFGTRRDGARDWLQAFDDITLQTPIGTLPRFLRKKSSDFPRHQGYLCAHPARVSFWRSQLEALGHGTKTGVCWRGGTIKTRREARSLTARQCAPLLKTVGCRFVCLQTDQSPGELAALCGQGVEISYWPEALRDFDELAALITALDVVVSVDSSVAHLSGALGKRVNIMLSSSPEWRYMCSGERMLWYPTARLIRQPTAGDWDTVVRRVVEDLRTGFSDDGHAA